MELEMGELEVNTLLIAIRYFLSKLRILSIWRVLEVTVEVEHEDQEAVNVLPRIFSEYTATVQSLRMQC
jgi:hypothetical protein